MFITAMHQRSKRVQRLGKAEIAPQPAPLASLRIGENDLQLRVRHSLHSLPVGWLSMNGELSAMEISITGMH